VPLEAAKLSKKEPRPCQHEYHPPRRSVARSTRCSPATATWPRCRLRRPIGLVSTKVLARVGPLVRFVEGGLPPSEAFDVHVLPPLGRRLIHVQAGLRTVREFARHDWPWYSHLVRAGERHASMEINAVTCPVTFVSGTFDVLASSADIRTVAKGLPDSRLVELVGSHYLPLEYPDELKGELTRLTDRA
jgi:3-oxoadipate enol-lactonase